jgi:D-alanine-D-alanine ligase
MITKKRIGVLAGGTSAEREVSLKSGRAVFDALKKAGYNVVFVDTANDCYGSLTRERVEVAFIALHGGLGENGAIQGFLEVMGIPYTGSGVLASALAMDKEISKRLFRQQGIPVAPYAVVARASFSKGQFSSADSVSLGTALHVEFPMPWVVKPATEGSSIGVNIVREASEVGDALEKALTFSERAIVEQYVRGREIQIGVLGQRVLGGVEVRPSREFYSYEAKYTPGLTEYILPPEIGTAAYETLGALALHAHNALGCVGATRTDFILAEGDRPFILEVNTIPGMTETSLLPKIARLSGLEFIDLIEGILGSADAAKR